MTTELKPCPFCGSDNVTLEFVDRHMYWEVNCNDCFAAGPVTTDGETEQAARVGWNTRHNPLVHPQKFA